MLVVAALGLTLPWTNTGAASLSMSAFDLAEWTTLVPEVRYGGNAMALPQQLRLLMVLMVFAVSMLPNRRFSWGWFAALLVVLAGIIALLPPFEYFIDPGSGFRGDVNYNQLMTLALIAAGLGVIGLSGWLLRLRRILLPITAVALVILALSALSDSLMYLNRYVSAQTGLGVIVFCGAVALVGLISVLPESKKGV